MDVIHERFMHATANEMKHLLSADIEGMKDISVSDIDNLYNEKGKFCSGCAEGKMKEHERKKTTKPLQSQNPGEVTVGDIMFIEMKNNIKKTLMIHVDVCKKMIVGVPLRNKSKEECTKALLDIRADYASKGRAIRQLVFDREPGIVPNHDVLNANGIELTLKAAGQKVGLAEVSIRLIREKARATKAGARTKFGYLPPNQFNMDLCMESISVLNRIPKQGQNKTPYELVVGKRIDLMRDFRVEWGETIVVKKPKVLSSDLRVTGQWAVVVRRVMNVTGVLKVYLIQTKKYAYRLKFVRATAPEWVLEALKNIGADANIGFEAENIPEEEEILEKNRRSRK